MNNIKTSLLNTIVWCSDTLDWKSLHTCHRNLELFPHKVMSTEDSNITYSTFNEIQQLVDFIIKKRSDLNRHKVFYGPMQGRILCFYPELSRNDAMVSHECQIEMNLIYPDCNGEYIDDYDNPPWDTWIACDLESDMIALYAWIHPELVSFISKVIAVDAYGCLVWAESLEKEIGMNL